VYPEITPVPGNIDFNRIQYLGGMENFCYGNISKNTTIGISIPFLHKPENKYFYEFLTMLLVDPLMIWKLQFT